jgi:diguanylate cyclase (GGDEF)-like protein
MSGITTALLTRQNAQLLASTRTDYRTGLLTMEAWRGEVTAELSRAERQDNPLAVAIIDIDHFKNVNDTFGHLAGDEVLRAVAGILLAQLRCYDRAGRYGGDEFVVLFPDTTALQAARIATRLCEKIMSAPVMVGTRHDAAVAVTVSIGLSQLTDPGSGLDDLLGAADAALYSSKRAGRCRVRIPETAHRALRGILCVVDIPLVRSADGRDGGPQRDGERSSVGMRKTTDVTQLETLQTAHCHVRSGLIGQILLREADRGPQGLQAVTQHLAVHQVQRLHTHALRQCGQPVRAWFVDAGLVLRHILRRHPSMACQLTHRQPRGFAARTQQLAIKALHSATRHGA